MNHGYTYHATLAASEGIRWRVEDIIGGDKRLDFTKPFMPEALARVEPLSFLTADEKLLLNQIRGNAYLCIFGLVEEFILPFVLDHARAELQPDDTRTRALLQFAGEEAKHIHLFKRFREEFERGFGFDCKVIGPPAEIARAILAHDPLGVALVILQIEWMTQRHYVESMKDDARARPAVQEPAPPPLDGGGAARQARHADGRGAGRGTRRAGARCAPSKSIWRSAASSTAG